MVDDPHREVSNPAHRYIVHLVAPGWDVIGATESKADRLVLRPR